MSLTANQITRRENRYNGCKSCIMEAYLRAKPENGGWNHRQIMNYLQDHLDSCYGYNKLPLFMKERLRGVREVMLDFVFAHILVNTCVLDGKRIASKDVPDGRWGETSDPCTGVFMSDGEFREFV